MTVIETVDMAKLVGAVKAFSAKHNRAPSIDETCALMGWSPTEGRHLLAAARTAPAPAVAGQTAPASPTTATPTGRNSGPGRTTPIGATSSRTNADRADVPAPSAVTTATSPPQPERSIKTSGGAIPRPTTGPERAAWHVLRAHGQVPTAVAVAGQVAQTARARTARRRKQAAGPRPISATDVAARDAEQVRKWVEGYRSEHGVGPLWRELADAMGWTPFGYSARRRIIAELQRRGDLVSTTEPRSLDVPLPCAPSGTDP